MKIRGKTSGYVLRTVDYGESDRIVSFFTEDRGKLRGIAKGARRSRKRFANALDLFSCSTILFTAGSGDGFALIEGCDVRKNYPGIRGDLEKTLMASYMIELVDLFTVDGKKNLSVFALIEDFLDLFEENDATEALLRFFEFRLLRHSGYEPSLERCVVCGTAVEEISRPTFRPADGGIRCERCAVPEDTPWPLSPGTAKTLLYGRNLEADRLSRVAFSPRSLGESRQVLHGMIRHIVGREIRSLSVLQEVGRICL